MWVGDGAGGSNLGSGGRGQEGSQVNNFEQVYSDPMGILQPIVNRQTDGHTSLKTLSYRNFIAGR